MREQEGRVGRTSAFKDLQHAEYVGNRGEPAPVVTTSGRTLNTMGLGPRASTDAERAGATGLRDEVLTRLQGGNPLPMPERAPTFQVPSAGRPRMYDSQFTVDPRLRQPGLMERIGNIAGPVLGAIGTQQRPGVSTTRPVPLDYDPNEYGVE